MVDFQNFGANLWVRLRFQNIGIKVNSSYHLLGTFAGSAHVRAVSGSHRSRARTLDLVADHVLLLP